MTCNHFVQSSILFGHGLHPQGLLLRYSPLKRTIEHPRIFPNPCLFTLLGVGACHMLEQIELYCRGINTMVCMYEPTSPEAQSPAGDLASAYPPKPLRFTLLGVGACDMLEHIEKLSRYQTIEQGLEKLSQYRSLEHLSNVAGKVIICDNNCRSIESLGQMA